MSGSERNQNSNNVVSIGASEADAILRDLRELRERIATAWSERAVMLSKEEQAMLHKEVKLTCSFLEDLTRGA